VRGFGVTRSGTALAAGVAAGYGLGVWLGYPVLVALAVGGLVLLLAAVLVVAIRPAVTLSRRVTPDHVHVGEPALGRIDVHNASRWPSPRFFAVDRLGAEAVELEVGALARAGRRAVHYPVPTPARGRVRLGPLTVGRRDPFGLVRWTRQVSADGVLWVLPRVHPMRPLPVGIVLDYEGRTTENARLGTVTFSSLREYVPGDDPRQIHWRSTARAGTLIVREHVDTTEPTSTVVLDTRCASSTVFEHAVEVAASAVDCVERIGRPVSLHILGQRAERVADAGAHTCLDRLAMATPDDRDDRPALLEAVDRMAAGGSLVVVTCDPDPMLLAKLAEQRRRFAPVVVVVILPAGPPGLAAAGPAAGIRRRPGMVVLTAGSGAEAASLWNSLYGVGAR
jgi:uncharacterized protein (DUF58 family)